MKISTFFFEFSVNLHFGKKFNLNLSHSKTRVVHVQIALQTNRGFGAQEPLQINPQKILGFYKFTDYSPKPLFGQDLLFFHGMNPYCIQPGTHFGPLNPRPEPAALHMAFATGLRLLRSHPLSLSFTSPSRLLLAKRVPELRFLSAVGPHQRRRFFAVKASSRRREDEVEDNGSVVALRDVGGNGGEGGDGRIVVSELHKEATEAYMAYAMSVLLGRALPDVRDGLKPVHRRILWVVLQVLQALI